MTKRQPIPFGKYLLLDRVNIGGMAEVWKAKTFGAEGFEKLVAIKRILPNIAEDEEFIAMFIDEAKISVQLTHANVAQVFDLGKIVDSYYIAMEYVSGRDMRAIFDKARKRGEPAPIPLTCYCLAKAAEGLDYAHRKKDPSGSDLNIVHRDVSPQNILCSFDGETKVIDFGIAKAANKATKTQAGILKGKFGYMSPEQVRGLPLDRRSDIFALGVVLYEMLTGERLFVGESDFSVLEKVRAVDILPPSTYNRRIPPELEKIVLKALAKDVEDRFQYASELGDELQRFLITSDSIFSRKDLMQFMKSTFAEDVEREKMKLQEYAEIKLPAGMAAAAGLAPLPTPRAPPAPLPPPPRPVSKPLPAPVLSPPPTYANYGDEPEAQSEPTMIGANPSTESGTVTVAPPVQAGPPVRSPGSAAPLPVPRRNTLSGGFPPPTLGPAARPPPPTLGPAGRPPPPMLAAAGAPVAPVGARITGSMPALQPAPALPGPIAAEETQAPMRQRPGPPAPPPSEPYDPEQEAEDLGAQLDAQEAIDDATVPQPSARVRSGPRPVPPRPVSAPRPVPVQPVELAAQAKRKLGFVPGFLAALGLLAVAGLIGFGVLHKASGSLVVTCTNASQVVIIVDGQLQAGATLPFATKLPAGPHSLQVTANGFSSIKKDFVIEKDAAIFEQLTLVKPGTPAATP